MQAYKIDCFEVTVESTGFAEIFPGTKQGGFDALECFYTLANEANNPGVFGNLYSIEDVSLTRFDTAGNVAHVVTSKAY